MLIQSFQLTTSKRKIQFIKSKEFSFPSFNTSMKRKSCKWEKRIFIFRIWFSSKISFLFGTKRVNRKELFCFLHHFFSITLLRHSVHVRLIKQDDMYTFCSLWHFSSPMSLLFSNYLDDFYQNSIVFDMTLMGSYKRVCCSRLYQS